MIDGIVTQASRHGAADTVRRVLAILERRGIALFARIDHAASAAAAGLDMPPAEVIVFGDPRAGTPLMRLAPTLAIDLPLRVLVWEDQSGATWLSYNEPAWLGRRHGLDDGAGPVLGRMAQSLAGIVAEAAAADPG